MNYTNLNDNSCTELRNNSFFGNCTQKIEKIEILGMGCIPIFQSEFIEIWEVIVFDYMRFRTITSHRNFITNSPIAITIPNPIRKAPTMVISDEPRSGSIIFPPVNAENPNRIKNGGVPYAITLPTNSIGILFASPKCHIWFFVCSHQAILLRCEPSLLSPIDKTLKSHPVRSRVPTLTKGVMAPSCPFQLFHYSFTRNEKQLMPAPINILASHPLCKGCKSKGCFLLMGLFYAKENAIWWFKVLYLTIQSWRDCLFNDGLFYNLFSRQPSYHSPCFGNNLKLVPEDMGSSVQSSKDR